MQVIIRTFHSNLGKCSKQRGKVFRPEKDSCIITLLCTYAMHVVFAPLTFSNVGICYPHFKDKNSKAHISFCYNLTLVFLVR